MKQAGRFTPAWAAALLLSLVLAQASVAGTHDLVLERRVVNVTGRERVGMLINGQLPGPTLRLKEGEEAVINVTNHLGETASIHWHGLIVPPEMDGVPGIAPGYGDGIRPGETFTYRFKVRQSGTYWFHSHSSGEQEQLGIYAPLIIEPREREPFRYDRDYVIMLSDWTDDDPRRILKNLKTDSSWYNFNRRTMVSLFDELARAPGPDARRAVVEDRATWDMMRMDPTDITDVGGLVFLVNGQSPERNFTALFRPGERVRLRFINASSMTYFDVRIPGLKMTVVQADGNNVQPVRIDEFRFGNAETYDVIVQPTEDRAYTLVAEPIDRTGYARATLAPRPGMVGDLPPHRLRPLVSMAEMGMNFGPKGYDRGTPLPEEDMPGHVAPEMPMGAMGGSGMSGMEGQAGGHGGMPGMQSGGSMPPDGTSDANHGRVAKKGGKRARKPTKSPAMPGMDHGSMPGMSSAPPQRGGSWAQMEGMNHGSMPGVAAGAPPAGVLAAATAGLQQGPQAYTLHGGEDMQNEGPMLGHATLDALVNRTGAPPGTRVLSYRDLKALKPYPYKKYDRIIEMRLTGNMQRYFWSINGRKFSEAQPIVLRYGERVRFRFINETMMPHPMHIHGTWFLPEVGNGARNPLKHTVNINPGATLDVDVPADAEGPWAFHCHQLYHMEAGMMRKIIVQRQPVAQQ
ncbi:multicopper oxidase domain-containing protein [Methylobacterium aquaticum]|uniref:multicopper oxidase domain-containing protein n=1 Tax=Methylobacterium aquaticum TaxID=270351 RepID=UPI00069D2349|nr:multicopper oxidase domain-containing protein [Methylobacterium aquaticum]